MARNPTIGTGTLTSCQQVDWGSKSRRPAIVLWPLFVGVTLSIVATIGFDGCSGSAEQARQATLEAQQAEFRAEQAEAAANRARAAAQQAEIAADRAQKAVDDASREINRVAEHLDRMGYSAGSD
jgi:multidrug efflux pump subunit AcrA (membrane-fusion protein)